MRISRKGVLRALGLVALALLVQAQSAVFQVEASRDSALCVQTCNSIRALCQEQCVVDCSILFPPGQDRNACESGCDAQCIDDSQECKAKCNVKKNPHPGEP